MSLEVPLPLETILTRETIQRIRDAVRQALDASNEQFANAVSLDGHRIEILPDRDGVDLVGADSGFVRFRIEGSGGSGWSVFFSINWRNGTLHFDDLKRVESGPAQ